MKRWRSRKVHLKSDHNSTGSMFSTKIGYNEIPTMGGKWKILNAISNTPDWLKELHKYESGKKGSRVKYKRSDITLPKVRGMDDDR